MKCATCCLAYVLRFFSEKYMIIYLFIYLFELCGSFALRGRFYSALTYRSSGFWDMYDPEGYSLWFCDYKYDDENTVSFVTLNKVGGFLQRMDLARKYAFGKMLVIGSEPPYKVKGLWLFRGKELPQFVLDECYDMELYEWSKVDVSDEAQKERVNAMIEDQEPFQGEALLDAKCFK